MEYRRENVYSMQSNFFMLCQVFVNATPHTGKLQACDPGLTPTEQSGMAQRQSRGLDHSLRRPKANNTYRALSAFKVLYTYFQEILSATPLRVRSEILSP